MGENKKHFFNDQKEFNQMRNLYLKRVEEEINTYLSFLNFTEVNTRNGALKEISLTIISTLLRKCFDLKLISQTKDRNKFNSVIHTVQAFHLENGDVYVLSDNDIKYKRKPTLVNYKFLTELKEQVIKWKTSS
ncbi:hypothetical protein [Psychroflexus sp. ALD_RP9]|uniref:hypothetical protein n=1 Tax=Psychroflexus sp. ALD_RP9 TaxID=2777186 RepID=UPI001A8F4ABF|nr:hypothetical protein [Psychroflexus sp. ALD_RP9]QSS96914.1 hypothetical protein IMZ30_10760 [Psychroflexus sp. ALD_RP9]